MTVFDPSALRRLEADTESRSFVHHLVETYQRMLTPRVERLMDALIASDAEEALDAALSLRVSSIMTGAAELAELASAVVDDLKNGDLPASRAQALLLAPAATRACKALEAYVDDTTPEPARAPASGQTSTDSIR